MGSLETCLGVETVSRCIFSVFVLVLVLRKNVLVVVSVKMMSQLRVTVPIFICRLYADVT